MKYFLMMLYSRYLNQTKTEKKALNCELQDEKSLTQDEKTRTLRLMGSIILLLEGVQTSV